MKAPSRALTTLAVGFLSLDAVLFGYLGLALKRLVLLGAAIACAAGAAVVVLAWRRYRRVVAELARARRAMKDEAESLRVLLQSHHLHN